MPIETAKDARKLEDKTIDVNAVKSVLKSVEIYAPQGYHYFYHDGILNRATMSELKRRGFDVFHIGGTRTRIGW